jgi:phosphatidate cytidylyltransferase
MMFSELKPRVRTASILIAAVAALYVIAIITDYARWIFLPVIFGVVGICAYEFASFCSVERGIKNKTPLYLFVTMIPPVFVFIGLLLTTVSPERDDFFIRHEHTALLASGAGLYLATVIGFAYSLILGRGDRSVIEGVFKELLVGVFQIGFCGAILMSLVLVPQFQWKILWLMLVVFSNDTAAYFVGNKIGGPKLAPEVSPNKTISGSVGGIFGGIAVGVLFTYLLSGDVPYTPLDSIFLALLVTITAQLGDLAKSYTKRLHGVKDSGRILPGHGGLLDRVDGLLLGAPALYFWLLIF